MAIVDIEHVTKSYRAHPGPRVLLGKGGLLTLLSRQPAESKAALRDVSLSLDLGQCIGIGGASGSGKTTLLKLIAGITTPSAGKVTVLGHVAPLIEPEGGFDLRLSGRENAVLQGRLQGLTRKEAGLMFETVHEFAELSGAAGDPVASYTTAMRLRLAFGIAVHTSADLIVIDSVLAQADAAFQAKCAKAIEKLREQGKTVVLVVDPPVDGFAALLDRTITLEDGLVVSDVTHGGDEAPAPEAEPSTDAHEIPMESEGPKSQAPAPVHETPPPSGAGESGADELSLERDED